MASRTVPLLALVACALFAQQKMAEPRYSADGQLLRPEGYREWVFVGASIGLGYNEAQPPRRPTFHNTYIQPEAYRHYLKTGQFPDKTMLVMEVREPGTHESINKHGQFEAEYLGVEAAVKDEKQFPDKWAYFNFRGANGAQLDQTKAFPKQACWNCHNEHAAVDNVFVQFYPVLRDARKIPAH